MKDQTKNCHEITFLLDAYHDKELSLSETEFVESHLATCLSCQENLKQITNLVNSLKSLPTLETSTDLTSKLDKLFQPGPAATPSAAQLKPQAKVIPFNRYRFVLAASAACAAIVFLTVQFWPKSNVQIANNIHQQSPASKPNSLSPSKPPSQTVEPEIAQSVNIEQPIKNIQQNKTEQKKQVLPNKENLAASIKAQPSLPTKTMPHEKPVEVATNTSVNLPAQNNVNPTASNEPPIDEGEGPTKEIATVYDGEPRSTAESIGIATDEDGLYAIKL